MRLLLLIVFAIIANTSLSLAAPPEGMPESVQIVLDGPEAPAGLIVSWDDGVGFWANYSNPLNSQEIAIDIMGPGTFTLGIYDGTDYRYWDSNAPTGPWEFSPSNSLPDPGWTVNASIPEPSSFFLCPGALMLLAKRRRSSPSGTPLSCPS